VPNDGAFAPHQFAGGETYARSLRRDWLPHLSADGIEGGQQQNGQVEQVSHDRLHRTKHGIGGSIATQESHADPTILNDQFLNSIIDPQNFPISRLLIQAFHQRCTVLQDRSLIQASLVGDFARFHRRWGVKQNRATDVS